MRRAPAFLSAFILSLPAMGLGEDLLRFTNGDQLQGGFQGMDAARRIVWKREDVAAPIEIIPKEVRQVVFSAGRPVKSLPSLSHVALVNGDRIPGTLRALDAEKVVVATSFAGDIQVARNQVGMIAPNPLSGRLVYHGPFSAEEWTMVTSASPDGLGPAEEKPPMDAPGRWKFGGSAWYWIDQKAGTALVRKAGMPDRALIRFKVAWKNRISLAFAFHADFAKPVPKGPEAAGNAPGGRFEIAEMFGNSYLIQINGSNAMLCRTAVEDGKAVLEAIRNTGFATRFGESDEATIEIRSNRQTGEIALFVNDEFVTQWSEAPGAAFSGKGPGFGFMSQGQGAVRISEISMAEWNGMPDSARSLQVDDQDVVLLSNGTDRLAGKITEFRDGRITLEGRYGTFQVPLEELAEIRFARDGLAKADEDSADEVAVRFRPLGRITGKALGGNAAAFRLQSAVAGELTLSLESAVTLEFNPSVNPIDDWDVPF